MSTVVPWESALDSQTLLELGIIGLAALAVGGVVYVLVMPLMSGERNVSKRVASAAQGQARPRGRLGLTPQPLQTRRKQVQDSIKDLEAKQKAKQRVPLRIRLVRAGLSISPRTFYLLSLVTGIVGGLIVLLTGSSPIVALLAAIGLGIGLPRWVLKRITNRRQAKFLTEFANAIDVIVRGVKSGLPLNDCLQIIATEAPEPVRAEFIDLVEQQRVGIPIARAFERMHERMPLQEVNFFAIVISIQAHTGGNLAEALGNLSQVLRDRYRLQAKVKTFSAEAKASAMILGSLPPSVMALVYFTSPKYMTLLFNTATGHLLLMGCGVWMFIGILVMRKMINFDY